jgi:hypothetical protein
MFRSRELVAQLRKHDIGSFARTVHGIRLLVKHRGGSFVSRPPAVLHRAGKSRTRISSRYMAHVGECTSMLSSPRRLQGPLHPGPNWALRAGLGLQLGCAELPNDAETWDKEVHRRCHFWINIGVLGIFGDRMCICGLPLPLHEVMHKLRLNNTSRHPDWIFILLSETIGCSMKNEAPKVWSRAAGKLY